MARSIPSYFIVFGLCAVGACTQGDPNGASGNSNTVAAGSSASENSNTAAVASTPSTTTTAAQAAAAAAAAQGPNVRLMGRVENSDPNGPIISWPASQIVVGFKGTSLTVNLTELDQATYDGNTVSNFFGVAVDNAASSTIKLTQTGSSYVVATGLTQGQHQVVLTKLTEGQLGRVQYQGVKTDGALTFTSAAPTRRIEFVGDSGTAGYGADGTFPCTFSDVTEDASVAYPSVVASLLSADVHNISYSGKGIVQNRDVVNDAVKTLPVLWQHTLPNDANVTTYVPDGWVPQAVVMTIGGNDFYAQVLDQTTFNTKVIAFIKQVQALYSGVHVYLGVSPMLRDDNHPTERESGLAYAQAAVTSMADSHVHYLDLPADLGANGYGCDEHMSPATHKIVAAAIAQVLKSQFSW